MSAKGSATGSGTPQASFRRSIEERSITFVLGAGVSKPRGVPDWRELTRRLWTSLLGVNDIPTWLRDRSDALARIRKHVAEHESPELARNLGFEVPHPLADQMAIEILRRKCGEEDAFLRELRAALYRQKQRLAGVSMYDVNLIRWLGVRYNAICEDVASQTAYRDATKPERARSRARDALLRHFWIRKDESDPHGRISALLLERGVRAVPLEAWGQPFEALMIGAFGLRPAPKKRATAPGSRGRQGGKSAGFSQKSP